MFLGKGGIDDRGACVSRYPDIVEELVIELQDEHGGKLANVKNLVFKSG